MFVCQSISIFKIQPNNASKFLSEEHHNDAYSGLTLHKAATGEISILIQVKYKTSIKRNLSIDKCVQLKMLLTKSANVG